ncbi:MAG: hypothetical protein IMHGJWDQ_000570 [Candidatus Fervidibacter sp.]
MFGLSPQELLIIAVIVVLLFGAKKVPEFFASLGKGIKEFKKAMHEEEPQERPKAPQEVKNE